jgi:hypothetical protein
MFCPRCSREQASEEVRFCNGCGFHLVDVAEALRNEGLVARSVIPETQALKKSVMKALVVMSLSAIFFLLTLILGTPEPSYFVQFNLSVGILCYLFGLGWIAHSFWRQSKEVSHHMEERGSHRVPDKAQSLEGRHRKSAPHLNEPDLSRLVDANTVFGDEPKTSDLMERPPSVTEGTTKLLEKDLR